MMMSSDDIADSISIHVGDAIGETCDDGLYGWSEEGLTSSTWTYERAWRRGTKEIVLLYDDDGNVALSFGEHYIEAPTMADADRIARAFALG